MGLMRKKLRFGGTAWLRELKCFAGFEDDDFIEKVLAVAHIQRFPEGGIVAQNGVADALRIIVEGTVEIEDEIDSTILVDGEYFGYSSALGTSLHAEATEARALSPVVIHVLRDEDVQQIVNQRTRCAWGTQVMSGRPCTPCPAEAHFSAAGGQLNARLSTPWQPPEVAASDHLVGSVPPSRGGLQSRGLGLGDEAMMGRLDSRGGRRLPVEYTQGEEITSLSDDKPVFDAWSWGWGDPSEAWATPRFPEKDEAKSTKKSGNKQRKVRRPRQLSDVPQFSESSRIPQFTETLRDDLGQENLPGDCTWPRLGGSPGKMSSTLCLGDLPASPQTARDSEGSWALDGTSPFFQAASARYPMSPIKSPWESPAKSGTRSPIKSPYQVPHHRGLMSPAKVSRQSHRRRRACA